ncbi:hypothetical protein [Anaerotalea alkaliphila]|uniref:Uncharacterized protein n=1 Tax=Anaerotalea alkaliphila TaxID=2662126 RepID=A0A7X5HTK5_9FIRM|nr:hypothetical protein [Anaerotalea alkaliphila]NDL66420.1 hypothetical protein [Anaerotalea alkaliphila]
MMRKMLMMIMVLGMFFLLGTTAYASSDLRTEYFFQNMEFGRDVLPADAPANQFGGFTMTRGLDRQKIATFATGRTISGSGDMGVNVGYRLYAKDFMGNTRVLAQTMKTLGATGFFTDYLDFNRVGTYFLAVKVVDGKGTWIRWYEITRREEATRNYLENLQINFLNL